MSTKKPSREILFRGKNPDINRWLYGDLYRTGGRIYINEEEDVYGLTHRACGDVDPKTVGQFIGLFDKRGTKVFEGDIVRINTHFWHLVSDDFEYRYDGEKGHALYVVKWDSQYCKFFMALEKYTKEEPRAKILTVHSHYTVVGNIHDNHELLKARNK